MVSTSSMTSCAVSIGDTNFTSSRCMIKEISINTTSNSTGYVGFIDGGNLRPIDMNQTFEINISLVADELNQEIFDELFSNRERKTKISKKKVEDCSVEELLFAVRKKVDKK